MPRKAKPMALPEPELSPEPTASASSPSSLGELTSSDVSPVKAGSPLKSEAFSVGDDEEEDENEEGEDEDEEEDDDNDDDDGDVEMTVVEPAPVEAEPEEEPAEDDDEEQQEPVCPPGTVFKYPPAVTDFQTLPDRSQRFKKARFTSCTDQGCSCPGLVPPLGAIITLGPQDPDEEEDEDEEESEDLKRWRTPERFWRECGECGHGWEGTRGHVGSMRETAEEGRRKGRVVGRIEELLNVSTLAYLLSCS
jgi:histone acetyltransferase